MDLTSPSLTSPTARNNNKKCWMLAKFYHSSIMDLLFELQIKLNLETFSITELFFYHNTSFMMALVMKGDK